MADPDRRLAGKRVLVTGAAGFIGSHLVERLVAGGAKVRALVRYTSAGGNGWLGDAPEVEVVRTDICDASMVRRAVRDVDVVFHLAALIGIPYSYDAPSSYVRTNVEGTLTLLEAARDANVGRFVHTSTSEVYGTARTVPMDETHPLQAQSPYAASKIAADKLVESFALSFGMPAITVRPFNTYGPRQSLRAVVPTIIAQALKGGPVEIGNTTPTRDLTFVTDTVDGFIAAAASDAAGVVNLGTGRETSIGDVAAMVGAIVGRPIELRTDPRRVRPSGSEVERLCAGTALANSRLRWTAQTSLEDGLRQTVDWIRAHLSEYRTNTYGV